jgi:RNA polymerase sigma factor (sigma-70 family)
MMALVDSAECPMSDFAAAVNAQRAYLLRIARLQLPERERAEDVVQETLLAALEGRDSYAGKSSVNTWLTGILKHKIVDAIRRRPRTGGSGHGWRGRHRRPGRVLQRARP